MFNWLNFLSYAIVTAVTPGPNNIMSMSNARRPGFRKSFPFCLGVWAGFSAVMLICTFFCNMLSEIIPKIKMPMLIICALYMLWLAWKTLKSSSNIEEKHSQSSFISGALLQFINPKIYIYCIVSMEAYILSVLPRKLGSFDIFCPASRIYRFYIYIMLVVVWVGFQTPFFKIRESHKSYHGTASCILCRFAVFIIMGIYQKSL